MPRELLVVVPAHNEEENLPGVMRELADVACADVLIVDDGSTDGTPRVIAENRWLSVRLPANMGLACAVQTGMRYAVLRGYRYAMQFDADGQHMARYIEPMLNMARDERADIVIGSRVGEMRGARRIGAKALSLAIRIASGQKIKDPTSGMRLYAQRLLPLLTDAVNLRPEPDAVSYLLRSGAKVVECPVDMRERASGKSYLNAFGSLKYMLDMAFSILILQLGRVNARLNGEEKQ